VIVGQAIGDLLSRAGRLLSATPWAHAGDVVDRFVTMSVTERRSYDVAMHRRAQKSYEVVVVRYSARVFPGRSYDLNRAIGLPVRFQ
jgi:hypothetical protein